MKKNTFIFLVFLLPFSAFSQKPKKPTLMIKPSEIYCNKKGFKTQIDTDNGRNMVPDYRVAFQEDRELRLSVSLINTHMQKEGFPLKDMENVMKGNFENDIELSLVTGKSKSPIFEAPIDKYKRAAKSDIILDLDFYIKNNGPRSNLIITLKGLDAYTNKQIAGVEIVGESSINLTLESLLKENNYSMMTDFCQTLQAHFDDMFANGREVVLRFYRTDNAPVDFEEEYEDKELNEIIDDWLAKECVQGRYSISDMTENQIFVEQARIPMLDENQKAQDARSFMQIFRKKLNKPPYNLNPKVYTKGLGEAWIVIDDK
jgi:hypothetical protein